MPSPIAPARFHVMMHGIVVLWGLTAILGKGISLQGPVLVAWRTGLAAVGLAIVLWWRGRPLPDAASIGRILFVGLLIGFHWMLFFMPGKVGTISAGLVGISTSSLWCALLDPLFNRGKRVGSLELGLSLAVVAGAALIAWFDPLTLPSLGLGVGAALVATIFSYCNATLVRDHDSFTITFFEMLAACGLMALVSFVFLDPAAPKVPASANDWILLLVLSQVCTVLAFSACVWLQKRLTVYSIGLASNLEPVYGIVLAAVVFREHKNLHFTFWIGSSIIIAAVLAYLPLQRRIEGWQQGRIS